MVGNHLHRHHGDDAGVQADAHRMFAQSADRGVHQDATTVHIHTQSGESVADDGGGHRAVQLVVFAHMHGNNHFQGFQAGLHALGVGAQGIHACLELFTLLFKDFQIGFTGHHGQALRQQEVAAVTGLDVDHIAEIAEIFHIGAKYQFHVRPP